MGKLKITLLYVLIGVTWLYVTDDLVSASFDQDAIQLLQSVKGYVFVGASALFLYLYLHRKEKFSKLQEEEERLSTLINSMVDFVNFKDGEGRWIEANDFGLELFQLQDIPYKGKTDQQLATYSPNFSEALQACTGSDEQVWMNGKVTRFEEKIPLPDGTYKTFDTIKVPLFMHDGSRKGLVIIGRDITQRVEMENRLNESEQKYKSLFDYNPEPVFMMDLTGRIQDVNTQFLNALGYTYEELMGRPVCLLLEKVTASEVQKIIRRIVTSRKGTRNGDVQFLNQGGQSVLLHCTSVPMIVNDEIKGVICYGKDVTVIRETQERLRKSEKLSVVGELAASVAHEVRNPLTSLKGFVQLLEQEDEKHQHYYSIMIDELNRINRIVSELLMLAKPQETPLSRCNIFDLLIGVKNLMDSQAHYYGASIDVSYSGEGPSLLLGETDQLKQIFINLIKNAVEASATKIDIRIMKQEESIQVIVQDNGIGIERDRIKHLGEPFYSSKEKGTGLGLTITHRIIHSHGGTIQYESEVGIGTTVIVTFPETHA
ncbi:PAS domain S-box protein [Priestia koreensis]|uniref:PAS domain S-box protein n=1 Tax=Priestia koreensis TaxID=284581 RepID=UPI0034573EA3